MARFDRVPEALRIANTEEPAPMFVYPKIKVLAGAPAVDNSTSSPAAGTVVPTPTLSFTMVIAFVEASTPVDWPKTVQPETQAFPCKVTLELWWREFPI